MVKYTIRGDDIYITDDGIVLYTGSAGCGSWASSANEDGISVDASSGDKLWNFKGEVIDEFNQGTGCFDGWGNEVSAGLGSGNSSPMGVTDAGSMTVSDRVIDLLISTRGKPRLSLASQFIPETICGSPNINAPIEITDPLGEIGYGGVKIDWSSPLTGQSGSTTISGIDKRLDIDLSIPQGVSPGSRKLLEVNWNHPADSGSFNFSTQFDVPNLSLASVEIPNKACVGKTNKLRVFIDNLSQCVSQVRARLNNLDSGNSINLGEKRVPAGGSTQLTGEFKLSSDLASLDATSFRLKADQSGENGWETIGSRDFSLDVLTPDASITG